MKMLLFLKNIIIHNWINYFTTMCSITENLLNQYIIT